MTNLVFLIHVLFLSCWQGTNVDQVTMFGVKEITREYFMSRFIVRWMWKPNQKHGERQLCQQQKWCSQGNYGRPRREHQLYGSLRGLQHACHWVWWYGDMYIPYVVCSHVQSLGDSMNSDSLVLFSICTFKVPLDAPPYLCTYCTYFASTNQVTQPPFWAYVYIFSFF